MYPTQNDRLRAVAAWDGDPPGHNFWLRHGLTMAQIRYVITRLIAKIETDEERQAVRAGVSLEQFRTYRDAPVELPSDELPLHLRHYEPLTSWQLHLFQVEGLRVRSALARHQYDRDAAARSLEITVEELLAIGRTYDKWWQMAQRGAALAE